MSCIKSDILGALEENDRPRAATRRIYCLTILLFFI